MARSKRHFCLTKLPVNSRIQQGPCVLDESTLRPAWMSRTDLTSPRPGLLTCSGISLTHSTTPHVFEQSSRCPLWFDLQDGARRRSSQVFPRKGCGRMWITQWHLYVSHFAESWGTGRTEVLCLHGSAEFKSWTDSEAMGPWVQPCQRPL